jgi:peroxiredoxin
MLLRMKNLLFLTLLLLAVSAKGQGDTAKVGKAMPKFTIYLDSGRQISSSSLDKKVVLINFFATWCVPCMAELSLLQKHIWQKHGSNKNFSLLVIGRGHSYADMQAFKTNRRFNLPVYPDKSQQIYANFAAHSIPRSYLIDKTGKVIYASIGFDRAEFFRMAHYIDNLLK